MVLGKTSSYGTPMVDVVLSMILHTGTQIEACMKGREKKLQGGRTCQDGETAS